MPSYRDLDYSGWPLCPYWVQRWQNYYSSDLVAGNITQSLYVNLSNCFHLQPWATRNIFGGGAQNKSGKVAV